MVYLSNKGFVHKDLAARNVLVSEDDTGKVLIKQQETLGNYSCICISCSHCFSRNTEAMSPFTQTSVN